MNAYQPRRSFISHAEYSRPALPVDFGQFQAVLPDDPQKRKSSGHISSICPYPAA
jgi:hypothetical protein